MSSSSKNSQNLNFDPNQLKIQLNSCYLLRADLLELIEKIKDERKTGLQERNGRGKMMDTILASGLKIIDLFHRVWKLLSNGLLFREG